VHGLDGFKDSWKLIRMQHSNLEVLHGGKQSMMPIEVSEFFGMMHGALKAPVKRAEFERSLQKRMEHGISNGVDVSDPMVMTRLMNESYVDGQEAILMQDNFIVSKYRGLLRDLELDKKNPNPWQERCAPAQLPAPDRQGPDESHCRDEDLYDRTPDRSHQSDQRVPARHRESEARRSRHDYARTEERLFGYCAHARRLFSPGAVGGLYQRGDKRDPDEVNADHFRIGDWDVPSIFTHTAVAMTLQVGATVRRMKDAFVEQHGDEATWAEQLGLVAHIAGGVSRGLSEHIPFIETPARIFKARETPRGMDQFIGQSIKGAVVPALVDFAAKKFDDAKDANGDPLPRKAQGILDEVKLGIPGLREQVPIDEDKIKKQERQRAILLLRRGDRKQAEPMLSKFSDKEKDNIEEEGALTKRQSRFKSIKVDRENDRSVPAFHAAAATGIEGHAGCQMGPRQTAGLWRRALQFRREGNEPLGGATSLAGRLREQKSSVPG
jgi:hypothetical protein